MTQSASTNTAIVVAMTQSAITNTIIVVALVQSYAKNSIKIADLLYLSKNKNSDASTTSEFFYC
jgi:hypothetical protein